MQLKRNVDWFALAAGALMFVTVASSAFSPWWRVQISENLATFNVDPFRTSFNILGIDYVVPIVFAFNIGTLTLFIAGGIALIVYSVKPTESYSKHLLSFGWKRPLQVVVAFVSIIAVLTHMMPMVINTMTRNAVVSTPVVPLLGSSTIRLPSDVFNIPAAQITVTATATFTHSFFLGIAAAVLSITARVRHRKISSKTVACEEGKNKRKG